MKSLIFALCLAAFNAIAAPAESFSSGPVLVERHGDQGKPIIMVPGLASGPWAFEGTVERFATTNTVYVLTLPGFHGNPAVEGKQLDAAQQGVLDLIASRKLSKPVILGHSIGGLLALRIAEQQPDLLGGVISIEGLPVFPGTEGLAAEQRGAVAANVRAQMAAGGKDGFAAGQLMYMRSIGVLDADKAAALAKQAAMSDPAATGRYAEEAFAADLRPGLGAIKVPVMLIAPYNAPDAAARNITEPLKADYYKSLMAGVAKIEVVSVAPARHFAMIDQPKLVGDAIERYLKAIHE